MMKDMCGIEGCVFQVLPSLRDWMYVHEPNPAINCRAIFDCPYRTTIKWVWAVL